jgi:hypothetical protein
VAGPDSRAQVFGAAKATGCGIRATPVLMRLPCGVTQDTVRITGTWKYGGTRYRDNLLRMRIDTDDRSANGFLQAQKEVWKERFRQIDIWITAYEVEII